ncbi:MAG: transaminase [Dongiaceae bacterium]
MQAVTPARAMDAEWSARLAELMAAERRRFVDAHPQSKLLAERARGRLLAGVPMPFMIEWPSPFPVFAARAKGARLWDVDGNEYIDFCLGDSGAMFGHAPAAAVRALAEQAERGLTFMLPTEDGIAVAEELTRRFGVRHWQFTVTATDANRSVVRLARALTGRPKVLVFNGCYHGTVDEAVVRLKDGRAVPKGSSIGPGVDPALTTRVVEFNDVPALEAALAHGDVACVLAEPALTNIGIVLPEPGFHDALRRLTRRHGTLLVIDETHTICAGPGGCTRRDGLDPDILTIGKVIAGGVPTGAYGCSDEVAAQLERLFERLDHVDGIGGTLAANALSVHAMRVVLETVMSEAAYARMIAQAERWEAGIAAVMTSYQLPWHVTRLGARAEYRFQPPMRSGGEAIAGDAPEIERFVQLFTLNRGVLMAPFHNMVLMSPDVAASDVERHLAVFESCIRTLRDHRVV